MLANNKKSSAEKSFGLPEERNVAALNKYLSTSIADELRKLAELRNEEILTEQEFQHIKQNLISKVSRT
jgi:molecular chaperone GrpE (heat shock protein)